MGLAGLVILMLSVSLLCTEFGSLLWRLKLKYFYVEGRARIEETAVALREGTYDLDITYHLELDGHRYRSTLRQDVEEPSSPAREDAEARLGGYVVGQLYPCWYRPDQPENNELLPAGLRLWLPISRLWIPFVVAGVGLLLCRPFWRELKKMPSEPDDR